MHDLRFIVPILVDFIDFYCKAWASPAVAFVQNPHVTLRSSIFENHSCPKYPAQVNPDLSGSVIWVKPFPQHSQLRLE